MEFEWDEAKNRASRTKHGFDFAFAGLIFEGPVRRFSDERSWGEQVLMITRKTQEQVKAEGGYLDAEIFDSISDADIERMIAEHPDLAPPTESLSPLLGVRDTRRKLGLTQQQLARKLAIPLATLREWERGDGRTDPAMQALLRILDRLPEPALRALDEPATAG
jgi:putative transcriptional regulator